MPFEQKHHHHADVEYIKRDQEGRRCDGNSRRCTSRTTVQLLVRRVNPDGSRGEPETKQSCGRHYPQFGASAQWDLISTSPLGGTTWPKAS